MCEKKNVFLFLFLFLFFQVESWSFVTSPSDPGPSDPGPFTADGHCSTLALALAVAVAVAVAGWARVTGRRAVACASTSRAVRTGLVSRLARLGAPIRRLGRPGGGGGGGFGACPRAAFAAG